MNIKHNSESKEVCHICYSKKIVLIKEYSFFKRVTSDCLPWEGSGKLGVCPHCGSVQKIIDADFEEQCKKIYDSYAVYHQSKGEEQRAFEQSEGQSYSRSELILKKVFSEHKLSSSGRLLDVGCGNGNLLRSFSKVYPEWTLSGSELNDTHRKSVENIKGVEAFYSCEVFEISEKFDLITMLHCLEHIVDPQNFLKQIRNMLTPGGLLLIEVPDYNHNPFDLLIADHSSHFDTNGLKNISSAANFKILQSTDAYIPKELTLLARKEDGGVPEEKFKDTPGASKKITEALDWLQKTKEDALKYASESKFGIFGTSIAGIWLYSELKDHVSFFVDEDPSRIGTELFGHTIYHPENVPSDSTVFIALPAHIADKVFIRMKNYKAKFVTPPES